MVRRRPLQVQAHARPRHRGEADNGQRHRLREIPGLGQDCSLPHRQLHVPLDPHGASESLRHRRQALRSGDGKGDMGLHLRIAQARRFFGLQHHRQHERQGHVHDRRSRGHSRVPREDSRLRTPLQGRAHLPSGQGPRRRQPQGLERLSREAGTGRGNAHRFLRGIHGRPGQTTRVLPFDGRTGHGPRARIPLRRGSGQGHGRGHLREAPAR